MSRGAGAGAFVSIIVEPLPFARFAPFYEAGVPLVIPAARTSGQLGMDPKLLNRGVNEGFSGGEKKRNEVLQMAMLEPKLAILDETDSGLDIDALKAVAGGVNALRQADRAIVLVTHYQRLLDYVKPDFVHVLSGGSIVKSGDKQLALELEERGYEWVREAASA